MPLDELRERGFLDLPMRFHKYRDKGFKTPTGKLELFSTRLEAMGYDPLPYYEEPPESPLATPEVAQDFPLVLTSGARIPFFCNSEHRQIRALRRAYPNPIMEVHPDTAAALGIRHGDWVWIETLRGKIQQKAKLTDGIDPRVVHVEHGWWFPEDPSPDHGVWRSNANVLTRNGPPYDPAMGTYHLRGLLCRIAPVAQAGA